MKNYIEGIIELRAAAGSKEKCRVLQTYANDEQFRLFLFYLLNPRLTYHISEQSIRPCAASCEADAHGFSDIFQCCSYLANQKGMEQKTLHGVQSFINGFQEPERELYVKLLAKTLRLGVTEKTVNKVIPDLILAWEVQQAYPIERHPIPPHAFFTLTQKLNGARATYYRGELIARSGAPYSGLGHILEAFSWCEQNEYVFDGELTLLDKGTMSDNEAFRMATGIINSDSEDKTGICYTVFDVIPTYEFEKGRSSSTYTERRSFLNALSNRLLNTKYVHVLPVLYQGDDQSVIPAYLDQMVREDKEGLIVNLDVPYQCKRHSGILKVKRFYTMDLQIIRCEEGSGRLAGTLGAFVLDYMGNEVRVGSGFSDEQRQTYWEDRKDLTGVLCEVKYKEISEDRKTGAKSLQFPVFVSLRQDKTEVSYG